MRLGRGRGPPPLVGDDPQIDEQPARTLANENKPKANPSQNAPSGFPCEANETFGRHFRRYAAAAGRQSILDAAETETDARELLQFAEARFHSLIHSFENSFFDCCRNIGRPFQETAQSTARKGRRV
jgi:hypothetical protein